MLTKPNRGYVGLVLFLVLASIGCNGKRIVRVSVYWPKTGKTSTPPPDKAPSADRMEGLASWYGRPFHGQKTANGETYNMNGLTAAHRNLPFDTRVRVTHLVTHKEVIVRINDRGPFVGGRIIDLSKEAARRLNMLGEGVARVRLEVVPTDALPAEHSATYTVQVGFFQARINALRLVERLKRNFENVSMRSVGAGGYQVHVGSSETRIEADRLRRRLQREKLEGFVRLLGQ